MTETMENRKIIFFDIDGTIYLYTHIEGTPQDTKQAIQQLRENGHIPVLCTGRTKSMIFPEILDLGFDGIIGGAGTYIEYQNKVLFEHEMPEALVRDVIGMMIECNIMPIAEGIDAIYFPFDQIPGDYERIFNLYRNKVSQSVKNINKENRIVASKISGNLSHDSDLDKMKAHFGDQFSYIIHQEKYLEMIPTGYSKATGIEQLINHLGINWKNTYAFGDSMNDYEMLRYVNYGIAMGNSSDSFKKQMKYVTDDFDKGGITNALKRFGLI